MNADLRTADGVQERLRAKHMQRTPRSRTLYERAIQVLPGGDTRTATFFRPYPPFMQRGEGCRLFDVDGNCYVDFLNNFSSLVHGHAHAALVSALCAQAAKGTVFGAPAEAQIELAARIRERVPSVEQIRFANSGSEAVMGAIRAARAFTGRSKLLKMEGGYHGSYDAVEVSIHPGPEGPRWPQGKPDGPGLSPGLTGEVLVAPFNDLETTAEIVRRHRAELAAVIIEPVMNAGGMIPADPDFLSGLREVTQASDVVFIFDEVVTFRLAWGGAQQLYGVVPDLTTFGKIIGGGLPVGAFGGRADIMGLFDPRRPERITHSGTFNGNPATLACGVAALDLLTAEEIDRINALGDRLQAGFRQAIREVGLPAQVTGVGSLAQVHLLDTPPRSYRDSARSPRWFREQLHLSLLNGGVFCASRAMFSVSTPMAEREIDATIEVFRGSLAELEII